MTITINPDEYCVGYLDTTYNEIVLGRHYLRMSDVGKHIVLTQLKFQNLYFESFDRIFKADLETLILLRDVYSPSELADGFAEALAFSENRLKRVLNKI